MKKLTVLTFLAAGSLTPLTAAAADEAAAEKPVSYSAELDLVSKYVWRGIPLSSYEAYQPSVNVSAYGFTSNIWFNYSVEEPYANKFSETDFELYYERELAGLSITPGYVQYTYPAARPYGDGYIKLSYGLGAIDIFTDQYVSMLATYAPGAYYGDAGLSYSHEEELLGWKLAASVGWANGKFNWANYTGADGAIYSKSAFNVLTLDGSLNVKAGGGVTIRPHLCYSKTLDGGLRAAMHEAGIQRDNLVIGLALNLAL